MAHIILQRACYQINLYSLSLSMAELFYREDRDQDFMNACEIVRQESDSNISVSQIVSKAILTPAKSFYIHPREYANIIRKGKDSLPKSEASKELHIEIFNRYEVLKNEYPDLKDEELNKIISEQSAPRFYISQSRGIILYYELIKR